MLVLLAVVVVVLVVVEVVASVDVVVVVVQSTVVGSCFHFFRLRQKVSHETRLDSLILVSKPWR